MKYALIGCGRIAVNHIKAALNNKLEIVAVCDVLPEKMEALLAKYELQDDQTIKRYTDYKEMVINEKPELVSIATESGIHAEIAFFCIDQGVNVIIEKPMAMSMEDADKIIAAAEAKNVKVSACHQNRFNVAVQELRKALEAGRFGKLSHGSIHVRWNRDHGYYDQASWRGTWEQDGGALMNQCIHGIDLLRWMMGDEVEEVYGATRQQFHDYLEAEDVGMAVVKFKNGAIGTIEGTTNVYPKNLEETLYIFGENGTVKIGGTSTNNIDVWDFADETEEDNKNKELKEATGLPAAASFKHVSPAGAAVAVEMSDTLKKIYFVDDMKLSPLATAYARARGADRMSSYGDFIALSDTCDEETARIINREVSDGVIAPDYTPEALEILKNKRKGTYNVIKIDPAYRPAPIEHKDVFGVTFEQGRNELKIDESLLKEMPTQNKEIPADAKRDLIIALITLKYTQSNSVCYAKDGQAIGIGAGQQSRIHCTRLAGNKADIWYLRQHPKVMNLPWIEKIRRADRDNTIDVYISEDYDDVLADGIWQQFFTEKPEILTREEKRAWLDTMTGVALGSDAFFPFGDNIERAHKSGVSYIAQPGGSVRDDHVIGTCDKYNMAMAFTGIRLFHH